MIIDGCDAHRHIYFVIPTERLLADNLWKILLIDAAELDLVNPKQENHISLQCREMK
jgi:hypothetical protein